MKYIALFISWLLICHHIVAGKVNVCADCQFTSVAIAVQYAQPGDTIFLQEGTYPEHDIVIDKPLVIMGSRQAIIDGQSKGEILTVISPDVVISDFDLPDHLRKEIEEEMGPYLSEAPLIYLVGEKNARKAARNN